MSENELKEQSPHYNIMNAVDLGNIKYIYNIKMANRLPRYISINTNNTISANARRRIRRSLGLNFRGVSSAQQRTIIMNTARQMRGGTRNFRNDTFAYRYLARDYNTSLRRIRTRIIQQRRADAKKEILTMNFRVKIYRVYQTNLEGPIGMEYLADDFVVPVTATILRRTSAKWTVQQKAILKQKYKDSGTRIEVISEGGTSQSVQTPIPANEILMQYVGVMNLDGLTPNSKWYKEDNHCVPDLLQFRYGRKKGLIKPTKTREIIEFWSTHIKDDYEQEGYYIDYELEEKEMMNPNKNGYSALNIKCFCKNWGINMYALLDEEVIEYHFDDENTNTFPSLVFEIKNNHIYPILDTRKIKSITNKPKKSLDIAIKSSTEMEVKEAKEEDEIKNEGLEIEFINKDLMDDCDSQMQYACEIMSRDNNMIYGNNGKSLVLYNGKMNNFKLGKKKYLMTRDVIPDEECTTPSSLIKNQNLRVIKEYCEKIGDKFVGQTAPYFMRPFVKEFTKHTFSYFSRDVFKALSQPKVKARTQWGRKERGCWEYERELWENSLSYDINKCYRSVMINPIEDFMTIGFEAEIERCEDEDDWKNEFGLFYVKTRDNSLFHYSNWYSSGMVQYAMGTNIDFEVCYKICGRKRGKTCLKEIIDNIKNTFKDKGLSKQVINCLYGYMMKTHNTTTMMRADEDANQIWNTYGKVQGKKNEKMELRSVKCKNGKTIHFYGIEKLTKIMNTNLPIGIQICDQANIKLYEMIKEMKYDGDVEEGSVLFRNTDCAVVGYSDVETYKRMKLKMDLQVTDEIGGFSTYIVSKKNTGLERCYEERALILNENKISYLWNDYKWNSSDDWLEIISAMVEDGGGMLMGRAGTGKSYVCLEGMKTLKNINIACKALAFTNKATIQFKGSTIHKFMTIDKNGKLNTKWARDQAKNIDVLIIDEISMISSELWKILAEFKYYTNCVFILVGDYRQLPPVKDVCLNLYGKEDWFNHSTIMWLANYNRCELTKMQRYDDDLWNLLEDIWTQEHRPSTKAFLKNIQPKTIQQLVNSKNICYKNSTRKVINMMVQDHLKPLNATYFKYKGEPNKYNEDIWIFKDAKLIMNMTTKCKTFKKNEEVFVVDYNDKSIILSNGVEELEIDYIKKKKCIIHKLFLLGYATTIHKSQGDTIAGDVNMFDMEFINEWLNDRRALYTGLSRAKHISKIHLSCIF